MKRDLHHLESRLRAERPRPSAELMRALTPRRRTSTARRQFAFATGLTAIMLIGLASVGGASYAANAVNHAVKAAVKVVQPKAHSPRGLLSISSGGDQYKPGYGFGDPNHNHSGPPGLQKGNSGAKTPPAQTIASGKAVLVSTSITVDEQAALYFSVLDSKGNELLLTQNGSKFGSGDAQGVQAKSIHYVMLVPRTMPFALRIPANLLTRGQTYTIRVIAVDADGNRSTITIPFTA